MAYRETIGDKIKELLEETFGDDFKEYFNGDPLKIPASLLPCIIVETEEFETTHGPTGMDNRRCQVLVKIVYNKKMDYGKNPSEVVGRRRLEELAEGIDEETGEYASKSVMGVLRRNFSLGNMVADQTSKTVIGMTPRPETSPTEEAHVRVLVEELIKVTGRA